MLSLIDAVADRAEAATVVSLGCAVSLDTANTDGNNIIMSRARRLRLRDCVWGNFEVNACPV